MKLPFKIKDIVAVITCAGGVICSALAEKNADGITVKSYILKGYKCNVLAKVIPVDGGFTAYSGV